MPKEETIFDKPEEERYVSSGFPAYQLISICASIIFSGVYANINEPQDDEYLKKAVKVAKSIIKESLKGE